MTHYKNMEQLISSLLEQNSTNQTIAIIKDENSSISYVELANKIQIAIEILKSLQFPKNICIGLRFDDPILHLIFTLALFKMKIKQTSLYPSDMGKPVLNKISEVGIDLILQDISLNNMLIKETIYIDENFNITKNKFKKFKVNNQLNKKTAIVLLGSGTTGHAKLIELKSTTYAIQVKNDLVNCNYAQEDIIYCFTNLYYQFALRRTIIALLKGATILLPNHKPKNIIEFCLQFDIDHLMLTGDQALSILVPSIDKNKKIPQLPKLKSCVLSSTMIKQPLRSTILTYVSPNLYISYGTNELGNISEASPEDIAQYPGTVGKINPNVKLKIVDERGNHCLEGESGNILVKTSKMMKAYTNNNEATEKSFTKDGYYPGDIGRLTDDGNLILEGRSDDMMIFTGVNVYPRELESTLESHPNVIEAAVFPMSINHHDGIPFAVVVTKAPMDENELLQYAQDELGWIRPQKIFFAKKLPKNDAGKVLKKVLAKEIIKIFKPLQ